jgi:CRISPR/Cas system CMR-associated protein Cmr5 small subunit
VRSSKTIYANLKEDLKAGCLIPPIVLSLYSQYNGSVEDKAEIEKFILEHKDQLFILDGLQRTYTIQDLLDELGEEANVGTIIRVEVYLGLNREGVLYRMLTLNTGQTPMSLRHQIEIIYLDLLDNRNDYGLKFIRDNDNKPKDVDSFYFSEAIDAFTSFVSQDYLQITREKLLSTIESFDNLSKLKNEKDAFLDLINVYSQFIKKMNNILKGKDIKELMGDELREHFYGENTLSIFNRSQTMTGYAAAVARLIQDEVYDDIKDVAFGFDNLNEEDVTESIKKLLLCMDEIRRTAKKIGNAQRCYFYYYFKSLLDRENDETYMEPMKSVNKALQNYRRDQ